MAGSKSTVERAPSMNVGLAGWLLGRHCWNAALLKRHLESYLNRCALALLCAGTMTLLVTAAAPLWTPGGRLRLVDT